MTKAQREGLAWLACYDRQGRRYSYIGKGWGRTAWEKKMDALVALGFADVRDCPRTYGLTEAGRVELQRMVAAAASSIERAIEDMKQAVRRGDDAAIARAEDRKHRLEYEVYCLTRGA